MGLISSSIIVIIVIVITTTTIAICSSSGSGSSSSGSRRRWRGRRRSRSRTGSGGGHSRSTASVAARDERGLGVSKLLVVQRAGTVKRGQLLQLVDEPHRPTHHPPRLCTANPREKPQHRSSVVSSAQEQPSVGSQLGHCSSSRRAFVATAAAALCSAVFPRDTIRGRGLDCGTCGRRI